MTLCSPFRTELPTDDQSRRQTTVGMDEYWVGGVCLALIANQFSSQIVSPRLI